MKNLYIFLLLIVGIVGFGQKTVVKPTCYADEVLQNLKNSDPSLQERMNRMDEDIRNYGINFKASQANRPAQTSFTIPVIVYVVHNNKPLGTGSNITDVQVQSQLVALNTYFVGSGLNFCLATKAGSQTLLQAGVNNATATSTTPGIVHVNNASIATHLTTSSSQQTLVYGTSGNSLTQDKFLRIWIVDSINGSTTSGIQGYSYLPNTAPILDGIVMNYRVFGNNANATCNCSFTANYQQGKILTHEVGHYLGLRHTFEGGCLDTSGFNNQILGDRVVDTPPVAQKNVGCPTNVDSCPADNLSDDISNYMDYTYDVCKNHFTTGQKERMLFHLLNYRSGLYDTDNLIFTGVCGSANLISSSFSGSLSNTDNSYIYNICSGSTMYFKPVTASTSYPVGSVITYLWDFGNGLTSTLENPSKVYNQSSNNFFNVTLIVTFNGNSSTSTKNIYVNNCLPIVNSESTWYYCNKNILKFNTGVPKNSGVINFPGKGIKPGSDFTDNTFQGINVQNDGNGNVLFFTDGKDVFNGANPAIKINNTMLIGSGWDYQDTMILKSPNVVNQYFIIHKLISSQTTFYPSSTGGIRYSIVNIINGIATISNTINIPLVPSQIQTGFRTSPLDGALYGGNALQAIEKANGGWWIVSSLLKTDGKSYLGIFDFSTNGTISLKNTFLLPNSYWDPDGSDYYAINSITRFDVISISPNGDKILYGAAQQPPLILDFDKYEGLITQTTLFDSDINNAYFAFSPNSKFIYSYYGQMEIDSPIVKRNNFNEQINITNTFAYGFDDKIYYISLKDSKANLSVIHQPNIKSVSLNPNAFLYQENILKPVYTYDGFKYLPNFVQSKKATAYDVNQISAYKVGCGSYKFFPDVPVNSATPVFLWNFGDPNSFANNTSSLNTPIHVFSGSGTYTVSLTYNGTTTITTQIVITTFTAPAIQGTSSVCYNNGNATTFNSVALEDSQTIVWTRTSGIGTILQNNQSEVQINWTQLPGTITATITDSAGCVGTVTKTISLLPNVIPTFNSIPTYICIGTTAPVLQTTSNNGVTGVWSPSIINNTISGNYTFNPNTNNCATPINISITVLPANDPLCSGNASCPPNLTLIAPETSTGIKNYKYKNWIKTMTNYSVANGKVINFKAQDYMVFAPNTHIMSGSTITAKIETCVVTSARTNLSVEVPTDVIDKSIILEIYPNPFKEIVNIQVRGDELKNINIATTDGKIIYNIQDIKNNNYNFETEILPSGIYLVNIETMNGNIFNKKIIKN